MRDLWLKTEKDIFSSLKTKSNGLSTEIAKKRILSYGLNEVVLDTTESNIKIFLKQFSNSLILILIGISLFSFAVGEILDGGIILGILLFNAVIGFVQEVKAKKSLEKLKKLVVFQVKVIRDGKLQRVDSREIVPGDIIKLNIGDIIPADVRLLEANNFSTNEGVLTGESMTVEKNADSTASTSDSPSLIKNGAFAGTSVATGSATAIVIYTAQDTFLGETVSDSNDQLDGKTNFEKSIDKFSNLLLKIVVLITFIICVTNAFLGKGIVPSLLFGITLAIGITPEVLPVIITIALSTAAYRLAIKKVVIKRLSSLEDIGNIDILCCDKTGTITEGKLSVVDSVDADEKENADIIKYSLICNSYNPLTESKLFINPTDESIWNSDKAVKFEHEISNVKILDMSDFDFVTKRMQVLYEEEKNKILIVKGATEFILNDCKNVLVDNMLVSMEKKKKDVNELMAKYEKKGYRLVCLAVKEMKDVKMTVANSKDLTFLGFIIFTDPLKENLHVVFDNLKKLNIKLKIITGDSPIVTKEICKKAGLKIEDNTVITGDELKNMEGKELIKVVKEYNIFARVTPEQKINIISILRSAGHVVGFIGDGINDVGAIRSADVGISVDSGTDVAKDSSDIILLKKDLEVLVDGISEGRKTFANTTKYILNTMSSSYGNVVTIAISSFFLKFLPLLPKQVLLLDSLSDGQYLTVSTDNVDEEFLKKPQKWNFKFFLRFMIFFGIISTVFDFILISTLLTLKLSPELFRSVWFVESVLTELVATFSTRTRKFIFKSLPSLSVVLISIVITILTFMFTLTAVGEKLFDLRKITGREIVLILILTLAYLVTLEIGKKIFYKRERY